MDLKTAIETGDAPALELLLRQEPVLANQDIVWAKGQTNHTHPLHYVCDMLFDQTLQKGKELTLIDLLLDAGADYDHQAPSGESPLIGAASLHAEDVGIRLLDAGANPNLIGAGKETALHWAAFCGLPRLSARLIEAGANLVLKDARFDSTPLKWAVHGRYHGPKGRDHCEVAAMLIAAGSQVEREWLACDDVRGDAKMLAVLTSPTSL